MFQGDFGYLQCSQPCHDELYLASAVLNPLVDSLGDTKISVPSDLLPRCPECGWLMIPWVRDEAFLEGEFWQEGKRRYQSFLKKVLGASEKSKSNVLEPNNEIRKQEKRVLFLELGVGGMTPSIIEIPFWEMTKNNPSAFYLRINSGKVSHPLQLEGRSFTVTADICLALAEILHS